MALYSVSNYQGTPAATTTSFKGQVQVTAVTGTGILRRGKWYEVIVGPDGAPNTTDGSVVYTVDRTTTATGTGTTVTPAPLDGADVASSMLCKVMMSIEPTITTMLLSLPLNQRASQRWIAAPGEELVTPATDLVGASLRAKSATLIAVGCHVVYGEG
jgi:hypothetical protein